MIYLTLCTCFDCKYYKYEPSESLMVAPPHGLLVGRCTLPIIMTDWDRKDIFTKCKKYTCDNSRVMLKWTPIKYRHTTDADGIDKEEFPFMFDCELPDNYQEVLITTVNGWVCVDTFIKDCYGCYFENYDDDEVIAWMPFPKPYKKEAE